VVVVVVVVVVMVAVVERMRLGHVPTFATFHM